MDSRKHAEHLGGLLGNLHTLEFSIRLCLAQRLGSPARGLYADDFREVTVGTHVPDTDMSNFASFGQLIDKFNTVFGLSGSIDDRELVRLRDVLAHGRVFAGPHDDHFRIIKFEPPSNGLAKVSYNQVMTEEWFTSNKQFVREAIETVVQWIKP
jgi:hypothetical protein